MEKDFNPGMKVHLNGEFGVVVKSETDNPNFHGVIRWDTQKEIDLDWYVWFILKFRRRNN